MQDFRELKVWDKAHQLTLDVYRVSGCFPGEERFGLTQQLRRSASSIPTNIAEGCGRNSRADYLRFLDIAMGSASETEYHLLLVRDLGMLPRDVHTTLEAETTEVKRMLSAIIYKLRTKS